MGKTSLLRHLAHHTPDALFPDGIVYLIAQHTPLLDLFQSLFDAFYECDVVFKATDAHIRHALQNKRALVILDDLDLARDEVGALLDTAPVCVFMLCATQRLLWGEGRTVELGGLSSDHSLALVERELGRPLAEHETNAVQSLHAALQGHPCHWRRWLAM